MKAPHIPMALCGLALVLIAPISHAAYSWPSDVAAWAPVNAAPSPTTANEVVSYSTGVQLVYTAAHSSTATAREQVAAAALQRLASSADLGLWQLVTSVRAQQQGASFALLESNLKIVDLSANGVSPVPLPGAAWLLVMGLLGLTGVKVTGRASGRVTGHERTGKPALQTGPAPATA